MGFTSEAQRSPTLAVGPKQNPLEAETTTRLAKPNGEGYQTGDCVIDRRSLFVPLSLTGFASAKINHFQGAKCLNSIKEQLRQLDILEY